MADKKTAVLTIENAVIVPLNLNTDVIYFYR